MGAPLSYSHIHIISIVKVKRSFVKLLAHPINLQNRPAGSALKGLFLDGLHQKIQSRVWWYNILQKSHPQYSTDMPANYIFDDTWRICPTHDWTWHYFEEGILLAHSSTECRYCHREPRAWPQQTEVRKQTKIPYRPPCCFRCWHLSFLDGSSWIAIWSRVTLLFFMTRKLMEFIYKFQDRAGFFQVQCCWFHWESFKTCSKKTTRTPGIIWMHTNCMSQFAVCRIDMVRTKICHILLVYTDTLVPTLQSATQLLVWAIQNISLRPEEWWNRNKLEFWRQDMSVVQVPQEPSVYDCSFNFRSPLMHVSPRKQKVGGRFNPIIILSQLTLIDQGHFLSDKYLYSMLLFFSLQDGSYKHFLKSPPVAQDILFCHGIHRRNVIPWWASMNLSTRYRWTDIRTKIWALTNLWDLYCKMMCSFCLVFGSSNC